MRIFYPRMYTRESLFVTEHETVIYWFLVSYDGKGVNLANRFFELFFIYRDVKTSSVINLVVFMMRWILQGHRSVFWVGKGGEAW